MPHIQEAPEHSDKMVHVVTYVIFTLLWFAFFYFLRPNSDYFKVSLIKSCSFAIIYGIVIEALQAALTRSRSADFNDFLANLAGISGALLVILVFRNQFSKLKSKF
nr:VanZ family protein [Leeuwenhoekiella parthenopeia]